MTISDPHIQSELVAVYRSLDVLVEASEGHTVVVAIEQGAAGGPTRRVRISGDANGVLRVASNTKVDVCIDDVGAGRIEGFVAGGLHLIPSTRLLCAVDVIENLSIQPRQSGLTIARSRREIYPQRELISDDNQVQMDFGDAHEPPLHEDARSAGAGRSDCDEVVLAGKIGGDLYVVGDVDRDLVIFGISTTVVITGNVGRDLKFCGNVKGDVRIHGRVVGHLWVRAEAKLEGLLQIERKVPRRFGEQQFRPSNKPAIHHDVIINGRVERGIEIAGLIAKNLWINGIVGSPGQPANLTVSGRIGGNVRVSGYVHGKVDLWTDGAETENERSRFNEGTINGNLWIDGFVDHDLWITGKVGGSLWIDSQLGGDLVIEGIVVKEIQLAAHSHIKGEVRTFHQVDESNGVWLEGRIDGDIRVEGFPKHFFHYGTTVGGLKMQCNTEGVLAGTIEGESVLSHYASPNPGDELKSATGDAESKPTRLSIRTMSCQLLKPMTVEDGVNLSNCDFRYFDDFEFLRFVGSSTFLPDGQRRFWQTSRQRIADTRRTDDDPLPAATLAAAYRRLRATVEKQRNRPGASDFYYGEMVARQNAAAHRLLNRETTAGDRSRQEERAGTKLISLGELIILTLYRVLSSFGLRAWLPICWFVVLSFLASLLFDPLHVPNIEGELYTADWIDRWLFAIRSMVSFLRPPEGDLNKSQQVLQIACRFLGPILIAQAVLAVRERVVR